MIVRERLREIEGERDCERVIARERLTESDFVGEREGV